MSLFDEELPTGKKMAPLGEHPKGYLIYTPEGRMMTVVVQEPRSPPKVGEDRINLESDRFWSGNASTESPATFRSHARLNSINNNLLVGSQRRV